MEKEKDNQSSKDKIQPDDVLKRMLNTPPKKEEKEKKKPAK